MPVLRTERDHMKKDSSKKVEFHCCPSNAREVFVAGTFNDWKPDAAPLHKDLSNVRWTTTLQIPPGYYEYKFVIDGHWTCESRCEYEYRDSPRCVPNEFGTMNRVIEVI